MSDIPIGHHHNSGWYEIRLEGHLDSRWAAWFEALSLTNESDGTTVIQSQVADQADLHGLLQKVRDISLPLLSVTQVEPISPTPPQNRKAHTPPASHEGERHHDHHPTRSSNETGPDGLVKEDRAGRGRALPDYL
ncbi:hypothetical protein [Arthrobacter sp. ISL-65]|uniref:hypothetical protein n=1 Tax=Arthrobacter sp. ISL-65 TaxID=2819112 RepID=UPI001BE7F23B|nr:hypothetical protein [Arthrobacter sp. ISL-65]MBT2548895.1 hypothetical protein [Arthrobacter sp. ISL-65]